MRQHDPRLLQRRDPAAWDAFYHDHLRDVYGFLFRLVGGARAADDLFQETWLEALAAIDQFDPMRGELRAWLFGIARRRVALYWRRRLSAPQIDPGDDLLHAETDNALLPEEAIEQVEEAAAVHAALLALPEDRRRVLIEKYVEGLSVEQIAARTGRTFKSIESLLTRAREELRSLLSWHFTDRAKGT